MGRQKYFFPVKTSPLDRWKIDNRQQEKAIIDAVRPEYERQVKEMQADYWLRLLGIAILCFREVIGSVSKTKKFASRFAEMVEDMQDVPTSEIVKYVDRAADIQMVVQD